jgi:hypothetical protein
MRAWPRAVVRNAPLVSAVLEVVVGLLTETIRAYTQSANSAALTVQLPSGAMMTHVMSVAADNDQLLPQH